MLGSFQLPQPIFTFINKDIYHRQLSLWRGVEKAFTMPEKFTDRDQALGHVMQILMSSGVLTDGKVLVIGYALSTTSDFPNLFEIVDIASFQHSQ
jgi:pyruvate kinase